MGDLHNNLGHIGLLRLRTSSSHKEGVERFFSVSTKEFLGDENGNLKGLITVEVEWIFKKGERPQLRELPNTEKHWGCDLVLLALGFTGPETTLIEQLGLDTDFRTNIKASTNNYMTNVSRCFYIWRYASWAITYCLGYI